MGMSTRWLLLLYPGDWRARYEDEFTALLEECPRSPVVLFDVMTGAVDARLHLHALLGRTLSMTTRLRSAEITIFCGFILFVLSGIGFQKMSEDFVHVQQVYPAIGTPFNVIVAGAVVALLGVLAGGLPLAFAALRYALRERRWDIVLLFLVPPVALAVWLGYLFLLINIVIPRLARQELGGPTGHGLAISLFGLFVLAAIVSTAAVAAAISRSEIGEGVYRFALLPAVVVVVAMAVVLAAVVAWGIGVQADAPQLYNGNHGILATGTASSWISHIVTMGLAVVIALVGLLRGLGGGRAGGRVAPAA
jgi:hypothetical protein